MNGKSFLSHKKSDLATKSTTFKHTPVEQKEHFYWQMDSKKADSYYNNARQFTCRNK